MAVSAVMVMRFIVVGVQFVRFPEAGTIRWSMPCFGLDLYRRPPKLRPPPPKLRPPPPNDPPLREGALKEREGADWLLLPNERDGRDCSERW